LALGGLADLVVKVADKTLSGSKTLVACQKDIEHFVG
jgi:hypothetical protein